ncbi:hypothetical protein EDF63_2246 [Curtobacterium sp. JUb34]|uniref:hypothetical protein n=1 Tax=Curtobacterium sp. JUb34 TaxID=2485109 RepID=UPI000F47FCCA|nr:hypothetical protein [Curtobacterium sp. JUb34]ROR33827.1 hypothetical protein EDF63_2246 [Curtobacterium sp. JUb34]
MRRQQKKKQNEPQRFVFDEAEFKRLYRWGRSPRLSVVTAFGDTAPDDPEMALRVLSKVRADAATAPAAILGMFALAVAALSFTVNLIVTLTKGPNPDSGTMHFGVVEAVIVGILTLGGLAVYVWQSTRHRCATTWKEAFEDSLRSRAK